MKLKDLLLITAIASAIVSAPVFAGPSAKFAATWNTTSPNIVSIAVIEDATADTFQLDKNDGYQLTTIKVPQGKELLVGISAEIGLTTDTSVKGQNGGAAKALADGSAWVIVTATPVAGGLPIEAAPGAVMLSSRIQALEATLGGVIEECTDTTGGTDESGLNPGDDGYIYTPDGTIDVVLECIVSDEQIGLMQDTLASHHFNFILPNMDAGEYSIKAHFFTRAYAEIDINEVSVTDGGTVSASSTAKAFVGKSMVTVQQVRAVKGSLADVEIVE
jgi:hypothetical protein